jgi:phospholipid transport system substrate-binding protein
MRVAAAVVVALGVVLAPWFTAPAQAGPALDQLKGQIDRVIKTLDDPAIKKNDGQRRAAVRKIAEDIFDFPETAKRSLARHWQPRTQPERDEFVQLFADLLERSYISKIELYGGEKIVYVSDAMDGDQAVVRTQIVTKNNTQVPVDYRMLKKGDKWLVYDVIIEGVSLIANYRTQFNKIIQTSSYPELVKKMKAKQEEFAEAAAKKS